MVRQKAKTNVIILSKLIAKNLTLRESADKVFDYVETLKENKIIMDFSRIEFVSRSFTDEYLERKQKTIKSVEERNLHMNVKRMFEIVNISRKKHNRKVFPKVHTRYITYKMPGL